jgi:hypothetical protein
MGLDFQLRPPVSGQGVDPLHHPCGDLSIRSAQPMKLLPDPPSQACRPVLDVVDSELILLPYITRDHSRKPLLRFSNLWARPIFRLKPPN